MANNPMQTKKIKIPLIKKQKKNYGIYLIQNIM